MSSKPCFVKTSELFSRYLVLDSSSDISSLFSMRDIAAAPVVFTTRVVTCVVVRVCVMAIDRGVMDDKM